MNGFSNAARERSEAQRAVAKGELKSRETYTAKQIAMRCGTDAKTMRKFFRSNHSTVEAVGQGGRYEFDAKDLPKIKREFKSWLTRRTVKRPKAASELGALDNSTPTKPVAVAQFQVDPTGTVEVTDLQINEDIEDEEPTEEELKELEQLMEEGGI